jgi:hypothetical protein
MFRLKHQELQHTVMDAQDAKQRILDRSDHAERPRSGDQLARVFHLFVGSAILLRPAARSK